MKVITKVIFLNDDNEKFFGEGPCRLLRAVEETGSLHAGANQLGMAYTKAMRLLKNAENALGYPLTVRTVGGKAGGGSILTEKGKVWLERYEAYRDACIQANRELYKTYFQNETHPDGGNRMGCVIMASGLGKRFGSNKLLADLDGEPMIRRILDATEGLFFRRVVVTRHPEIKELCQREGIPVILHELPGRNDTIRLGLEAIGDKIDHCMFCPADQPLLTKKTIGELIAASQSEPERIWRVAYQEQMGAPVVFPQDLFSALMNLPEGKGGGVIIRQNPGRLRIMQIENAEEIMDVDTCEDLAVVKTLRKERSAIK